MAVFLLILLGIPVLSLIWFAWAMRSSAMRTAGRRTRVAFDAAARAGIPLTLGGHTHGGQIMLNPELGAGPLMYRYWSGLYRKPAGQAAVISNGAGNWFPLRTAAPAEILHLTLRRV